MKKDYNKYAIKGLLIICMIPILILGYNSIKVGTYDSLAMLFPLSIYIISISIALLSNNFYLNIKLKGKERLMFVVIGLAYILIYLLVINIVTGNLTYEYKHTVPFFWLSISDNAVLNVYDSMFSASFVLMMVLYSEIIVLHRNGVKKINKK